MHQSSTLQTGCIYWLQNQCRLNSMNRVAWATMQDARRILSLRASEPLLKKKVKLSTHCRSFRKPTKFNFLLVTVHVGCRNPLKLNFLLVTVHVKNPTELNLLFTTVHELNFLLATVHLETPKKVRVLKEPTGRTPREPLSS